MTSTPKVTLVLSALLLIGIAWLDVFSGDEVRITSLYVIPILLVTWNNSKKWGYAFAAISIGILLAVDPIGGATHSRHLYFYVETFGRILSFLIIVVMASNSRAAYDRERKLARTDELTHLMNRHAFYASMKIEIARGKRHLHPFSLLYLDCDNFKQVNDSMGHREGDQLLCLIANTMRTNVRKGDIVARMGGDEFAIFFPDTDDKVITSIALELTQKLKQAVIARYPQVSFSAGIAVFLKTCPSLEDVIMRADQLMYQVKTAGKNGLLQGVF